MIKRDQTINSNQICDERNHKFISTLIKLEKGCIRMIMNNKD